MISFTSLPDNSYEVTDVEYRVAGLYSVMFDLANPFYNDVSLRNSTQMFSKVTYKISYDIEGGVVSVRLGPHIDDITQAVFDIKNRYLLQPLYSFVRTMERI